MSSSPKQADFPPRRLQLQLHPLLLHSPAAPTPKHLHINTSHNSFCLCYSKASLAVIYSMPGETEPLLPRYEDDTARQRQLHQKLHSYQMFRALSEGYLPSTEQAIANLRTLLASDILNVRNQDIGSVGRQLVRDARLFISCLIEFLHDKNSSDKLQNFLWRLSRARVAVDQSRVSQQAAHVKARADTKAGGSPCLSSTHLGSSPLAILGKQRIGVNG